MRKEIKEGKTVTLYHVDHLTNSCPQAGGQYIKT